MHHNLSKIKNQDKQKILCELISKYGNDVLKHAYLYVKNKDAAEDVFQDVFIKVYKHLEDCRNLDNIKGWLIKITINVCRDMHNSPWNNKIVLLDNYDDLEKNFPEIFAVENETEKNIDIWAALKSLPLNYKNVLVLYCIDNYTSKEISDILNVPESTVKSRLRKARVAFRNMYERMVSNDG